MVDGFSCILDFPKFSGGGPPDPPYKGNTSVKPSESFFNNNSSSQSSLDCLSFYFVCDDKIQVSCDVCLHKMENLAVTFCYLWLTEKLWLLGEEPPHPPLKH